MSTTFDAYAAYYDLFNSDKDYAAESEYIAELIRRHTPDATQLLELGCGTGAHAAYLIESGFSVTGLDLSERMLDAAHRRRHGLPEHLAAKLYLLHGDVRSVALETRFDAVIALFHVASYQTTDADLAALLDAAARHLPPGGLFLFDFWYGPAVLSQWPEVRIKRRRADGITVERLAEPEVLVAENRVRVTYTIRVDTDPAAREEQFSEVHDMRYFFLPELRRLSRVDFEVVEVCAWHTHREPSVGDWSAMMVLRKR